MEHNQFIPYEADNLSHEESSQKASAYRAQITSRRSLRFFSDRSVDKSVIEDIIMAAASAPSGAHKQPWTFCAICNPDLKAKIREAAEAEEYINYSSRMSAEWLADLKKFDTNHIKEFITTAPWIIVLFKKSYDVDEGAKKKNYYVSESVGIAAGFLISAIHNAGLVTLTHTPSPMNFLQDLLQRPEEEKPYLLLPVGYPADNAVVPVLTRKSADEVIVYYK
jgi:iodotyrosine deiodinase